MSYDYPMEQSEKTLAEVRIRRQTLQERLVEQKIALESQLSNINDAIGFLDSNPSFENFHNIIRKAGF